MNLIETKPVGDANFYKFSVDFTGDDFILGGKTLPLGIVTHDVLNIPADRMLSVFKTGDKLNMPKQKKKDGFGYAVWKKRYDSLRNEKHKTNKNLPSAKYGIDVCDKAIELAKRHYEEAQIDFDYAQNRYEQDMILLNLINEAKAALGKK